MNANKIIQSVCKEFGIEKKFILGPTRSAKYAVPRQEAYWRIYQTGNFTLPQIGRFFGGRHHTTIMYGIRKAEQRKKEKSNGRECP